MKKYSVTGTLTISVHCEVLAVSPEHAVELARDMEFDQSFAHHYSSRPQPDQEWCTSGELEGEPENLKAELSR